MPDIETVRAALAPLRAGYEADGYELHVDQVESGVARVRIAAGPDACEECLVPKPITLGILRRSLKDVPDLTGIELIYPTDH